MKDSIEYILNNYSTASYNKNDPVYRSICSDVPSEIGALIDDDNYSIKGRMGAGNKAEIPWISILDSRITDSTQKGLYIVYLFKADMSGFYLALGHGITFLQKKYKKSSNKNIKLVCDYILNQITDKSFSTAKPTLGSGDKAKGYSAATIISKYYNANNVPDDSVLLDDLQHLLKIYKSLSDSIAAVSYETVIDNIINGYTGDLGSMTGVAVKTKMFTWVPFFKELADKLLAYKNKRDDLVKLMGDIYTTLGEKNPLDSPANTSPIVDVDPFTVLAMINRGINETKKIKACEEFKNRFGIQADVPEDFVGVPTKDNRRLWFFTRDAGCKTGDLDHIDNIWDFFEAALKYDKDQKDQNNENEFIRLFDKVMPQKLVSWSLTFGLFWIRPDTYMTFDDRSKVCIESLGLADSKEISQIKGSGANYISICQRIKNELSNLNPPIKDFKELSLKAWNLQPVAPQATIVGYNKIYYGMPGCGKSHKVEYEVLKGVDTNDVVRTTFYQDYSYSDFMGQILPVTSFVQKTDGTEEKVLSYKFVPGPFVSALEKAYADPDRIIYLVIEEINRGNAPSIFGDAFQLLDRVNDPDDQNYGRSRYGINNDIVMQYLNRTGKLYIPENLVILATMNTSDQNVFTLDAAFKRRWQLEEMRNDWTTHPFADWKVPGTKVSWKDFVEAVNTRIVDIKTNMGGTEDKRLGAYFVQKEELTEQAFATGDPKCKEPAKRFAYKVLEYLWDDVCRFNKSDLFDVEHNKTLSQLIDTFLANGLEIFADGVFE